MTEEIGKVRLDYSKYPGEDLYCDGAVEDELLDIVKSRTPAEYASVIEERASWPILYHLSPIRENIVDWVPMGGGGEGAMSGRPKVLEVGSGCGAITGVLSRKAGSLTCVDLSRKRSLINAWRHRECDNITIHVGNFKDIEPDLPGDYDFICLIGVFEYGQAYIGGDTPYEDFLRILMSHLAPGGRILIAIENKYGLKYFAGCKEDHLGTYFSGIENYREEGGVRTFGRKGLEKIFRACGAQEYHFYYPYPDYKFMTMLYSDDYLPRKGDLSDNLRNFDRDRMLLFDEKNAFDGMVEEELFPVFANSYLAVIGGGFDTKYVKYSNDRDPEYAIRTEIAVDRSLSAGASLPGSTADTGMSLPGSAADTGASLLRGTADTGNAGDQLVVRKYPLSGAAAEHIRGLRTAYESLSERYRGSALEINACQVEEKNGSLFAQFEFVGGTPLSELMDRCLEKGDLEGFRSYFWQYVEKIGYNSEYPAADFDLIFSNILVEPALPSKEGISSREGMSSQGRMTAEDRWTLIDYEWTFGEAIQTRKLAFRALYCYLLEDERRNKFDFDSILGELGITEEEAGALREQERTFQRFVTGNCRSMGEVRNLLGHECYPVKEVLESVNRRERLSRIQIYEDRGEGFREENSYFADGCLREDDQGLHLTLTVEAGVRGLRIDPAFTDCVVRIKELKWNGRIFPHRGKAASAFTSNGTRLDNTDSIVFSTQDPNLVLSLGEMPSRESNCLEICLERSFVDRETALDIECAAKRRFRL